MNEQMRERAWASVEQSVETFLELTGQQAKDVRAEVLQMLEEIRPEVEHHLSRSVAGSKIAGQSMTLLADAVAARTARLILLASQRQKMALAAVIQAVLRTALLLAA